MYVMLWFMMASRLTSDILSFLSIFLFFNPPKSFLSLSPPLFCLSHWFSFNKLDNIIIIFIIILKYNSPLFLISFNFLLLISSFSSFILLLFFYGILGPIKIRLVSTCVWEGYMYCTYLFFFRYTLFSSFLLDIHNIPEKPFQ